MADGNESVTVAVLKTELAHQRELNQRDHREITEKLDGYAEAQEKRNDDHETRIRKLESQGKLRWFAEAAIAIAAAIGIGTGVKT